MMSFQCNTYFNIEETAKKYNINYKRMVKKGLKRMQV